MNCKNCRTPLAEDSNFCPKCGARIKAEETFLNETSSPLSQPIKTDQPPKNSSKKGCLGCLGVAVVGIILLIAFGASTTNDKNKTTPVQQATNTATSSTNSTPTETKPVKVENWKYTEQDDTIHNAKIKFARTSSINTLNFKFPYAGAQHATLFIRKNYDGSKNAMVMIEKGQFMTSVLGGKALIRFDDNSPEEFQILAPQDNSTTTVFIKYADYFIENVAKSKKLYFQTPFFQEGSPTLEFNVEGLNEL